MKTKTLISLIILCVFIVLDFFNVVEFIHAKQLQKKIERYNSIIGIELKEEGPIYYDKINDQRYKIWFGATLGESKVFDSKYQEWFDYFPN